jgi:hypothetical protein
MGKSLDIAANFIFKLHAVGVQHVTPTIKLYPVMDGIYVTSRDQNAILDFLAQTYHDCASEFLATPQIDFLHRFLIRGALAFGPIVHGATVPPAAFQQPNGVVLNITNNAPYLASILIGLPMVQSHETEKKAPPFGLYVHESARSFSPPNTDPIHFRWWKWGLRFNSQSWPPMRLEIDDYFRRCLENWNSIEYEKEKIKVHQEMAMQYFT